MCQSFHSNTGEQQQQHGNLRVPPHLESQRRSRPALCTHRHEAPTDCTITGFKGEQGMTNEAPGSKQGCRCCGKCVHEPHRCPGAGGTDPAGICPGSPHIPGCWRHRGAAATVWGHITPWGGLWGCISAHPPPQQHWHQVPVLPFPPSTAQLCSSCARGCSRGLDDSSPLRPSSHSCLTPPQAQQCSLRPCPLCPFPRAAAPLFPAHSLSPPLQVQPCSIAIPPPQCSALALAQCFMHAWFWQ